MQRDGLDGRIGNVLAEDYSAVGVPDLDKATFVSENERVLQFGLRGY